MKINNVWMDNGSADKGSLSSRLMINQSLIPGATWWKERGDF